MLFLLRSAVCIGLVASALPDRAGQLSLSDGRGGASVSVLSDLCRADVARCRAFAGAVLAAEPSAPATIRKLRDQPAPDGSQLPRGKQVL